MITLRQKRISSAPTTGPANPSLTCGQTLAPGPGHRYLPGPSSHAPAHIFVAAGTLVGDSGCLRPSSRRGDRFAIDAMLNRAWNVVIEPARSVLHVSLGDS